MRVGVVLTGREIGYGGETAYLRNVLNTIRRVQPHIDLVLLTGPESAPLFSDWEQVVVDKGRGAPSSHPVEASLERAIRRAKVERLFTSLREAPSKPEIPQVLHVLDLHFLQAAAGKRHRFGGDPLKEYKRLGLAAACLVAPSEALRKRLLQMLTIPINHMVVALPGVDEPVPSAQPPFVQRPFLLTMIDTHPRSNLPQLLDAFKRVNEDAPCNLVVVGTAGEAEPTDWGPGVLRIDECPPAQLAGLYAHSDACICPSLLEADTLILLKAMRAGARIVAPRVGGVPEIAASAPVYFEPHSTPSLASAIRRVLTEDPADRARYIKFGQQRAAEFTWEQCAWKVLSALRKPAVK